MTTLRKLGIVVLIISIVAGWVGTAWSIYMSFAQLENAAFGGIGPVGDQITYAILFTVGGLVGTGIGLLLFILGRSRSGSK